MNKAIATFALVAAAALSASAADDATFAVRALSYNVRCKTVADQVFKVGDTKPLTWVESGLGWSVQFGAYKCAFEEWARSSGGSVVVLANGRVVHVVNGQIIQEDIVK